MKFMLWELSIPRNGGMLYCRIIAGQDERGARKLAAVGDPCWNEDAVLAKSLGDVYGDEHLNAMKMIVFVPNARCPTCGK